MIRSYLIRGRKSFQIRCTHFFFLCLKQLFLSMALTIFAMPVFINSHLSALEYPAFLRETFRMVLIAPREGMFRFDIKEGTIVTANQVLFTIHDPILPIMLEKALLARKQAETNLVKSTSRKDREETEVRLKLKKQNLLHRAGGLSDDALEISKAELENQSLIQKEDLILLELAVNQAENEVKLVSQRLKDLQVLSPVNGALNRILIQNNEWVQARQRIAEIIGIDPLIIYLNLPIEQAFKIRKQKKIPVNIQRGSTLQKAYARVLSVAYEVDAINQTIQIRLDLANKNHLFLPGMKVNVEIP